MLNVIQAVVLGLVEGITEFLPVSSTFHLIVTSRILGLPPTDFQKMFEVVIQAGAILAVLVLYGRELGHDRALLKKVLVSFIPTAVIGWLLYKIIKEVFFEAVFLQLIVFALVGILFIIFERGQGRKPLGKVIATMTYQEAIWVGVAQSLAVIPGVSRAGAVLLALLAMGVSRDQAAKYSFLLALPTILAASALDLFTLRQVVVAEPQAIGLLVVGLVVAFGSALIVMKWLIGYLQRHTLTAFGWYRLVVTMIIWFIAGSRF